MLGYIEWRRYRIEGFVFGGAKRMEIDASIATTDSHVLESFMCTYYCTSCEVDYTALDCKRKAEFLSIVLSILHKGKSCRSGVD